MSSVKIQGNASGSGQFTVASPNSNNTRTATLPDADGNVVLDSATQTLTNKTIQGGAITAMTAQASTSGTSIDFTSIPSWVKRITVVFAGVSTNGASPLKIQFGDAGGFENTGYLGYSVYTGTSSLTNGANFSSGFDLPFIAAAALVNGTYIFSLVSAATNTWAGQGVFGRSDAVIGGFSAGSKALSGTLTQVRVTTGNGTDTFDAGTINVLYEG